jgi:hypothetical protein
VDDRTDRNIAYTSALELFQDVLNSECGELQAELKIQFLELADHPGSNRPARLKRLIQAATRD